jgi:predicted NodU family carbamoyl transferase
MDDSQANNDNLGGTAQEYVRRPPSRAPRFVMSTARSGGWVPSKILFDQLGVPHEKSELTAEQKRNFASGVQAAIPEVISDLLESFRKKTGLKQICLGGGVFQNALLVASLERKFGVGSIFVPPAPGNAGCALGAAAWIWHQQMGKPRNPGVRSV